MERTVLNATLTALLSVAGLCAYAGPTQDRKPADAKPDPTEAAIRSAIASRPSDADARLLLGDFLVARGRLDQAKAEYEAVVAAAPGCIAGYARTVYLLLVVEKDPASAIDLLQRGAARAGGAPELRAMLGHAYLTAAFRPGASPAEVRESLDSAKRHLEMALQGAKDSELRASVHLGLAALHQLRSELGGQIASTVELEEAKNRALSHYSEAFALHPVYREHLAEIEAELAFPRSQAMQVTPGSPFEKSLLERLRRLMEKK